MASAEIQKKLEDEANDLEVLAGSYGAGNPTKSDTVHAERLMLAGQSLRQIATLPDNMIAGLRDVLNGAV